MLSASVVLAYYQFNDRLQEMADTLSLEGSIIADHISHDSGSHLLVDEKEALRILLADVIKWPDVDSVEIVDENKRLVVSAGAFTNDKSMVDGLEIIRPIIYKSNFFDKVDQKVQPQEVTVGWLRLNMSVQSFAEKKRRILINSLAIFFIGLAISVMIAFLISKKLLTPLKKLHAAVERISAGHFNAPLSMGQSGEFGEIENGINKIANDLQLSKNLQKEKIDEATEALMELVLQLEQKNVLLDEARKKAEEIGNSKVEFLANMSHEIRTPLNAVIGASNLLMKIVRDSEAEKYMSTLAVASRQLNSVVDDILDFSRMEANKLELEHVTFNIMEVLENVISLHAPLANEKGLELMLEIESGMPDAIFGDPMRISQVVSNLVSNAIKFTEKGQVIVSASSVVINNINLRLQIKVKDTGAGLTSSAQKKLFDAFSQADNAIARKFGGSGLGLAIVRKLIEQMQGFINVKSNVGEGTEFTIHLDLKLDHRKKDELEKSLSGISVLLYERDAVTEKLVKKSLLFWGVEVTFCNTDDNFIGHLMKYKTEGASCDCIIFGMGRDALAVNSFDQAVSKIRHLSQVPVVLVLNASEYVLPSHISDEKVCCLSRPVNRQTLYSKLSSIKISDTCNDVVSNAALSFRHLKILIAEDNTFSRDLLTDMLLAFGAQVESVDDGQYAVEAALNGSYDIIFLDLHMPRKDGITAANEIRQAVLDKPPLLIAATADVFIKEQGSDVDVFDCFVFKPIREEILLEKVATLLNFQGDYKSEKAVENTVDDALSEKLDREVRKLVLHIVEGSNNDDYAEIIDYAHQLRGVCGFYELTEMSVVAAGLEKSAKEKRREDIVLLIKVLLKKLNISPDYKKIH